MWFLEGLYAQRSSDTPAIIARDSQCSFRELWEHSEWIARNILLPAKGGRRNAPIVFYGDKHPTMLAVMAAALKTGSAYVPVDIRYPVERLAFIANAVDAPIVFNFSGQEIALDRPVIDGTALDFSAPVTEEIDPAMWLKPEEDAYILFTSGSTGTPKGVPISRSNLENYGSWYIDTLHPEKCGQCSLDHASYSFDLSTEVVHVFLPLGKTLVSVDKKHKADSAAMVNWMRTNRVASLSVTPSFADLCLKEPAFCEQNMPMLDRFLLVGEILQKSTLCKLFERFPHATIINAYGPTETTVEVSACMMTREMLDDPRSLPIGQMLPEADYRIVDEQGNPLPDGQTGELVIFSKSTARGYFNDPERTAKAFILADDGRNGYRTGDLVWQENGMLYYVGRKDFQIKYCGYRIELGDIVSNLDRCERVESNLVIPAMKDGGGVNYLAAFIVLAPAFRGESVLKNTVTIKKELAGYVPEYMVPRKLIFLEEMPLNKNGKIDRDALKALL